MKLSDPIKLPTTAFNQLNQHIAGVALLFILNVVLVVRLGFAFSALGAARQDQLRQEQLLLAQLQAQTVRLNGLPEKVDLSRKDADKFYAQRVPANYSSILAELGDLATKNNIRMTRAGYTQTPAIEGLAQLNIDANLSGEYSGIMRFINGLERDKMLFVINTLTLTGQQGGLVNLRLRVTTYLHAADASQIPLTSEPGPDKEDQPAPRSTDQSALRPGPLSTEGR